MNTRLSAMTVHPLLGTTLACWLLLACATDGLAKPETECPGRRVENFNRDWKFARGSQPGAEAAGFDDGSWQAVRLPHDWAISGPYEPQGDAHTGKLPWRGEGWYRKQFLLPTAEAGRRVYLDFDGVMALPTVYVNGQKAGGWDYGYMSFRVDATDLVRFGQTNLVAVHVDTRSHNSRWYPGAGIYRKVQLVFASPVHVAHWGTFVSTPEVSDTAATVRVRTTIESHQETETHAELETILLDPKGKVVAQQRASAPVAGKASHEFDQRLQVLQPQRWDVTSPRLYRAVSRVLVEGQPVDTSETPFGIRTFEFTANDGFHLNGRRVQLYGVNLHHDHGPLGAAFFTRAMERQLQIMKEMGVNAIRTSHNPPAPELLDLCDRMGLVVWDEVFDKWDGTATRPKEVSMPDHGQKQIGDFVRRDRNHPSVVVWSAGNEIWDLEGGKFTDSPGLLRQMVGFFKEGDTTRPVALAHCVSDSPKSALDDALDVTGWNYARRYALSREKRPQLPIIYSESASAYSTRGHYELPLPEKKDAYSPSARISSYDLNCASYSDLADTEFALMERDRFVAGEFVWTGFDYLGEPVPFVAEGWSHFTARKLSREEESRISSFGIVDLVGIPKDRFYLYRAHWAPEKKTIHILPHWNWPDRVGQTIPVFVYTSGDTAELFLNGKSLGKRSKNPQADNVLDRYRLRWENVGYQPGVLKAVAYQKGRKLGEAVMRTAGAPAKLRLTPDRSKIGSDGDDLCYVLVEALDQQGNLCPLAMNEVTFGLTGPATIAGVGNGDHHFPAEFDTDQVSLFYGKAMLIVRANEGRGGRIGIKAESSGLKAARAAVRAGRDGADARVRLSR
ncbi:MAG TPA: glycoside hydrolase family 2 TIM barrel-domain containing protein [Candidatus Sulfotelmatobacter sp.]|nr:glycoside hydrolase family 2 TIM barrel-domain containing protein [Candidatus Sulfotelmatobacter sp.]